MYEVRSSKKSVGFTLIELLVVVAILTILAAIIIPRISGVQDQAQVAVNANSLQGVAEAAARFEAQFRKIPTGWDGVVDDTDVIYTKLNPKLSADLDAYGTKLAVGTLTAMQAQSLTDAGMTGIHKQDSAWTGLPSESGRIFQSIATGLKVCQLSLPTGTVTPANFGSGIGHNKLFSDRAFSIHPYASGGQWNNSYIVVGFGNEASLKRNAVQDTPIINSAQPEKYYARILCVYMIPASSVTATTDSGYFKAKFIGCISPDGTCVMDNLDTYSKGQVVQ